MPKFLVPDSLMQKFLRDEQVSFVVKVKPNAKKEQLCANSANELELWVRAQPVEGAANERVIAILAEAFSVAKSKVQIISGMHARIKRICVCRY